MTPSSLELTVLGAGPAYTNRLGSTGAAYLVRGGETAILLDLGQGSFPRLATEIEPSRLDAVIVSHLHPDHFIDLVPLRHYLAYQFKPARRVRVFGPSGLAERIDALHARPGFTAESLDCTGFPDAATAVGALTIEARLVTHTDESYAVRVSGPNGSGLVYSGDCGVDAPRARSAHAPADGVRPGGGDPDRERRNRRPGQPRRAGRPHRDRDMKRPGRGIRVPAPSFLEDSEVRPCGGPGAAGSRPAFRRGPRQGGRGRHAIRRPPVPAPA